jgi:acyl-CoA thioester hydrolase
VGNEAPNSAFVVRSIRIDFRKPARMDDVLEVASTASELKGASFVLHQQVRRSRENAPRCRSPSCRRACGRSPKVLRDAIRIEQDASGRHAALLSTPLPP